MGRVQVLTLIGLAAIISALLYVINGASHDMVWTYQYCVAWHQENCASESPIAVHCNHVGSICTRTEPRTQPWVYVWLVESVIAAVGITLARIGRHDRRTWDGVFRAVTWSILGALGYVIALEERLTSAGLSSGGVDAVLPIFLEVFFAAFVGLSVLLFAIRPFSSRIIDARGTLLWSAIAILVLIVGAACGWRGIGF